MKKLIKRYIASIIAISSLSLCTITNFANATEQTLIEEAITSTDNTRVSIPFTLKNVLEKLIASDNGYASVNVYVSYNSDPVNVYVYDSNDYCVASYYFDTSGHSSSHSLTIPSGEEYSFYVQSSWANASHTVNGNFIIN